MIFIGKNIAGKDRFMVTLTGTIILTLLAWGIGKIFMPKIFSNKKNKMAGVWYNKINTGFSRLQVKDNGYFYFDIVSNNGKPVQYKGVLDANIKDTLRIISFNNDTLLFHRIIAMNGLQFTAKSLRDSSTIIFTK